MHKKRDNVVDELETLQWARLRQQKYVMGRLRANGTRFLYRGHRWPRNRKFVFRPHHTEVTATGALEYVGECRPLHNSDIGEKVTLRRESVNGASIVVRIMP